MKIFTALKKISKNLLALFIGVILALIIAEIALRIFNPVEIRIRGDKMVLPSFKRYERVNEHSSKFDKKIIHSKNSIGFRGDEPFKDLENYLSLISIGGSTTENFNLSDDKTWTAQLGKKLERNFRNVWINNAGYVGLSTFAHIILMNDIIVKIKPKMVLFLVGANDTIVRSCNKGRGADVKHMKDHVMPNTSTATRFVYLMAEHSDVFAVALNIYRYTQAKKAGMETSPAADANFENLIANVYLRKGKSFFSYYEKKMSTVTKNLQYTVLHRSSLKCFGDRLEELIRISKEHNIDPILITQPYLHGVFIDDITSLNFSKTYPYGHELKLFNEVIRHVGERKNVLVVDLAKEMPKSSKYFTDGIHFSNKGAEVVAEIIEKSLYFYLADQYHEFIK